MKNFFNIIIFLLVLLFIYAEYRQYKISIKKTTNLENTILDLKNLEKKNYNIKFLPETQFTRLIFNKKNIKFNNSFYDKYDNKNNKWRRKTFFLDEYFSNIIVSDYFGNFYYFDKNKIIENNNLINLKDIISNFDFKKILDIKIFDNTLYVTHVIYKNNCQYFSIYKSEFNLEELNFTNFFTDKTCADFIQAGRIAKYKHNNIEGILVSTSNQLPDKTDSSYSQPQDKKNIFGKILFFDLENGKYEVFSLGHRNVAGLYADEGLVLATEHGPRGGDEINKIIYNSNYGWPISSYGEKYSSDNSNSIDYLKSHKDNKFKEPIYSYVPSIGISEIIRLSNNFSKHFQNNFIISSLADNHIYRVKFDDKYNKIIYQERIFIGNRIRDLKYIDDYNAVILALESEENASIGILMND